MKIAVCHKLLPADLGKAMGVQEKVGMPDATRRADTGRFQIFILQENEPEIPNPGLRHSPPKWFRPWLQLDFLNKKTQTLGIGIPMKGFIHTK